MIARRLLSLLALLALVAMPLAHMQASAHGAARTSHCHGSPASPGKADKASIDCAIACAAIAPANPAPVALLAVATAGPDQAVLPAFDGIRLDSDPPPPRAG